LSLVEYCSHVPPNESPWPFSEAIHDECGVMPYRK